MCELYLNKAVILKNHFVELVWILIQIYQLQKDTWKTVWKFWTRLSVKRYERVVNFILDVTMPLW